MKHISLAALASLCLALALNAADDGGALKGSVKFDGDAPEPKIKPIPEEKKAECKCQGKGVPDESLEVNKATKGIKWAIVRIMDVQAKDDPPKPTKPLQIDQKSCTFTPHVIVVPPETDIQMLNPDAIQHNIHTHPFDSKNPEENILHESTVPVKAYKGKWLGENEIIQLNCDMHSWMKGYIVVHDPRFCAVTPADGTFEIKNVPPGKYKISIFQESCGEKTLDVEIKAGATADLGEVKFAPKKK